MLLGFMYKEDSFKKCNLFRGGHLYKLLYTMIVCLQTDIANKTLVND